MARHERKREKFGGEIRGVENGEHAAGLGGGSRQQLKVLRVGLPVGFPVEPQEVDLDTIGAGRLDHASEQLHILA